MGTSLLSAIQRISEVGLSQALYMSIFTKKCCIFFERIINMSSVPRCIYRYQKWIPDNFLHRNDNSIFFSTHFFSTKIFTLKIAKYFLRKFSKFSKNQFFSKEKSDFPSMIFENFPAGHAACTALIPWESWDLMTAAQSLVKEFQSLVRNLEGFVSFIR